MDKNTKMDLEKYIFAYFLLLILVGILVSVNVLFFSTHLTTFKYLRDGTENKLHVISLVSKPEHGRRGYKYKVNLNEQTRTLWFNSKLTIGTNITVLNLGNDENDYIVATTSSHYLDVYAARCGGYLLLNLMWFFWIILSVKMAKPLWGFIGSPVANYKET